MPKSCTSAVNSRIISLVWPSSIPHETRLGTITAAHFSKIPSSGLHISHLSFPFTSSLVFYTTRSLRPFTHLPQTRPAKNYATDEFRLAVNPPLKSKRKRLIKRKDAKELPSEPYGLIILTRKSLANRMHGATSVKTIEALLWASLPDLGRRGHCPGNKQGRERKKGS